MIHLSLKLILPSTIAHHPVLDGWLDFKLPPYWSRKGGSSNNITCLSWPDLFLDSIIYLPSLILICLQVWPTTQYPYPGLSALQYIYIYIYITFSLIARFIDYFNRKYEEVETERRISVSIELVWFIFNYYFFKRRRKEQADLHWTETAVLTCSSWYILLVAV